MARTCPRPRHVLSGLVLLTIAVAAFAAGPAAPSPEQMKASFNAHKGDFDYLLGDWEFTTENKEYGKGHGFWTAIKLADGQILDNFRIVGDKGEIYYSTATLRAYDAKRDEWDLVSADSGSGLKNRGTGRRDGAEVRIEQTFGAETDKPSLWRIRYYDIKPDSFSWSADLSKDGGKSWTQGYQTIRARRIGPPHAESPFERAAGR